MKKLIFTLLTLALVASGIWAFILQPDSEEGAEFKFAEIARGDIENVVSGTGTLNPVGTVEVGTQVSGTIDHLYADFNDHVAVGQLLAVLDTSALAASVREGEASVARTRAQYNLAVDEYDRHLILAEKGYLSEREMRSLATQVETAKASLQSAEATLLRLQTNFNHAEIRAPIDGTVIQRSVEAGQTVAASLQTPTIFIIAEDMAQMEILALVDESDIGLIREGQDVRFTVQAYPDEEFSGTVRQIRLKPETIQNVVNYTVVVDAPNKAGLLLPGMTATVDFVAERVEDVLIAPSAALRFQPTQEMMLTLRERMRERGAAASDSTRRRMREQMQTWGSSVGVGGQPPAGVGRLWYIDERGAPAVLPVRLGATDGLNTEVVLHRLQGRSPSADLNVGMQVITGTTTTSSKSTTASNQQRRGGDRRTGPPGFF
jgi:HlyD family secretion protein